MQALGIDVLFQGNNFLRLLGGLWVTIRISMISVGLSFLFGLIFGMIMTSKNIIIQFLSKLYLNFVRIMPQLVLLFLVYFGVTKTFSVNFSGELSAVIVFVVWGTAEMGDLVRSAIISVAKHQYESGKAIGLNVLQLYWYIIVPQTVKRLIPNAMNLVTRMIKTTSLVALIGVIEVVKVGQQMIETARYTIPSAAIWIYAAVFFLYFAVCYPISLFARRLEKNWGE